MSKFKCTWPTDSRRITSPYGPRSIGDGFHDGIDIGRLKVNGEPIYATHNGMVAMSYFSKTYGNCVIINDKATNYSTLYGHMKNRIVEVGQTINQGDTIGYMGTTGNSTGVHLHFEVRNKHYGSSYWNSHDGEFYSSYDPEGFIVDEAPLEEEDDSIRTKVLEDLLEIDKLNDKIKSHSSEIDTLITSIQGNLE